MMDMAVKIQIPTCLLVLAHKFINTWSTLRKRERVLSSNFIPCSWSTKLENCSDWKSPVISEFYCPHYFLLFTPVTPDSSDYW